jgi:putative membrane protein
MNTLLAHPWNDGGGPGPWVLLFPVIWALVVVGIIWLLRRAVWRGRGPWQRYAAHGEHSPVAVLGRRFAAGEIDADEYRRKLSVLDPESAARSRGKDGAA